MNRIWTAAGPVASALAPLINYGLGHIKGSLATWRYMFIFAGSITVLWALVIFLCMDADPVSARHLSEREKFIAVSRLRSNNTGIRNAHFKRSQAFEALTSLQFWLLFSISVCVNLSLALPLTFTPLIIAGMGFSGLNALLLTIPSGVFGTISVLLFAYWLQRVSSKNWRTYVISALVAWMIIACCINWRLPHLAAAGRLFWIYMLGVYPTIYALLMSLSIANAAGYTKRSVFSTGLFIAYCVGTSHSLSFMLSLQSIPFKPGKKVLKEHYIRIFFTNTRDILVYRKLRRSFCLFAASKAHLHDGVAGHHRLLGRLHCSHLDLSLCVHANQQATHRGRPGREF